MPTPATYLDPRTLRLPVSRPGGADPAKLHRQIAQYGKSTVGMLPLFVFEASDAELIFYDGVTRATRVAKLMPGSTVPVQIIGTVPELGANYPTVQEKLP